MFGRAFRTYHGPSDHVRATSSFHAIQDFIVCLMASDPKPPEVVFSSEGDSPVRPPDINRPDISFGPKTERRMIGILFEKPVLLGGQVLYFNGEFYEEFPKA